MNLLSALAAVLLLPAIPATASSSNYDSPTAVDPNHLRFIRHATKEPEEVVISSTTSQDSIDGTRSTKFGNAIGMIGPFTQDWALLGIPLSPPKNFTHPDGIVENFTQNRLREFHQDFDFRHLSNPELDPTFPSRVHIALILAKGNFGGNDGPKAPEYFLPIPISTFNAPAIVHLTNMVDGQTVGQANVSIVNSSVKTDAFTRLRLSLVFSTGPSVSVGARVFVSIIAKPDGPAGFAATAFVVDTPGIEPEFSSDNTGTIPLSAFDASTSGKSLPIRVSIDHYILRNRAIPIHIEKAGALIRLITPKSDGSGLTGTVKIETSSDLVSWSHVVPLSITSSSDSFQFTQDTIHDHSFMRAIFVREARPGSL